MADVLTMSENAGTLAQQIGEYLATQGSTPDIQAIGRGVSGTATNLLQEVGRRRTRRAPGLALRPAVPAAAIAAIAPATEYLKGLPKMSNSSGKKAPSGVLWGVSAAPAASAAGSALRAAIPSVSAAAPFQLPNVSKQSKVKPVAPVASSRLSPISVPVAEQQAARTAAVSTAPATSGLSDLNRKLLEVAAAPVVLRRVEPVYSAPKQSIFGRALEAAKGALKPSAQQTSTATTKPSTMSVADAFKMGGGYRRTRRVRRKNVA